MSTSVLFSTFPPFPTLSLRVPSETRVNDLYDILCDRYPDLPASDSLHISPYSGSLTPDTRVSELHGDSSDLVTLRIIPRLRGGKGGFGSQLRAAGGRMSSQKTNNNDSCRDLSGRRLSTIKTAKRCVHFLIILTHLSDLHPAWSTIWRMKNNARKPQQKLKGPS